MNLELKYGDPIWFVGMKEGGSHDIGEQMATYMGETFSGYIRATLFSGRECTLPPRYFRRMTIGPLRPA